MVSDPLRQQLILRIFTENFVVVFFFNKILDESISQKWHILGLEALYVCQFQILSYFFNWLFHHCVSFKGQNSPPIHGASPRNSSPVQDGGNLTNNLSQMDLNATISDKMLQMSMEEKDEGLGTTASNNSSSNLSNFFLDRRAPGI